MLVKCKYCGGKIDRDIAYKVESKPNKYYCTKAEYDNVFKQQVAKDGIFAQINDIFGYKVLNTALFKEINLILQTHNTSKINAYIKENFNFLDNIMRKGFQSEYAKIRYFSAILKNNLSDFVEEQTDNFVSKEVIVDMPDTKYKLKKKKKTLAEIESEV